MVTVRYDFPGFFKHCQRAMKEGNTNINCVQFCFHGRHAHFFLYSEKQDAQLLQRQRV